MMMRQYSFYPCRRATNGLLASPKKQPEHWDLDSSNSNKKAFEQRTTLSTYMYYTSLEWRTIWTLL